MATVGKPPRNAEAYSNGSPVDKDQLRRDRINLVLVIVIFGALIGLMVWLASMAPPTGGMDNMYPIFP